MKHLKLFKNKRVLGFWLLVSIVVLWWAFYAKDGPGFYLLVRLAKVLWRDQLMEAIHGHNIFDTIIFNVRLGPILFSTIQFVYFLGTFFLLAFIGWKAVRNLLVQEE